MSAVCLVGCAESGSRRGDGWAALRDANLHLEEAKDTCARETGDSKTPGFWFGYSNAFMRCMTAHDWIRVGNPL